MSGLEQTFAGEVAAYNVDASTPEAQAACKKLGFKNHGLVIRGKDGRVVFKQADHSVKMDEVEQALRDHIGL